MQLTSVLLLALSTVALVRADTVTPSVPSHPSIADLITTVHYLSSRVHQPRPSGRLRQCAHHQHYRHQYR